MYYYIRCNVIPVAKIILFVELSRKVKGISYSTLGKNTFPAIWKSLTLHQKQERKQRIHHLIFTTMTRKAILFPMLMTVMMLTGMNVNAQRQRGSLTNGATRSERREAPAMNGSRNRDNRRPDKNFRPGNNHRPGGGFNHPQPGHGGPAHNFRPTPPPPPHRVTPRPHVVVHHHPVPPRLDARGYVPGWEGRVRHCDGRWGYYRDEHWYWYDSYFAPEYYYAHPITHFHSHICGPVAAGVVGGAVLGALISAMCR